jgi:hypothetical protein
MRRHRDDEIRGMSKKMSISSRGIVGRNAGEASGDRDLSEYEVKGDDGIKQV